jgi:exosome complex RNA-binding protein Rrp42 (RNase PH superfamily)
MKVTLIELRDKALKEIQMINEEMTMTLDASGNIVPIHNIEANDGTSEE